MSPADADDHFADLRPCLELRFIDDGLNRFQGLFDVDDRAGTNPLGGVLANGIDHELAFLIDRSDYRPGSARPYIKSHQHFFTRHCRLLDLTYRRTNASLYRSKR